MQAKIKQLKPLVTKKRFAINEGITDEEFLVADEQHRRQQMMKRIGNEVPQDGPPVNQLHTYYKQYQNDQGNDLKLQREKLLDNKDNMPNNTFTKLFLGDNSNSNSNNPP